MIVIFFKVIRDPQSNFSRDGNDIIPWGEDRVQINITDYVFTPGIQNAFTDPRYNFNINDLDDESFITFNKILKKIDYDRRKALIQNGINVLKRISRKE